MATAWTADAFPNALLVIAPHPDDEVLGCGSLMRRVVSSGGSVIVVWMTDGGASHGALDAKRRAELVARRQAEAMEGLAALGIESATTLFLGVSDGDLDTADAAELGQRLQRLCDAHAVDTVVVTDGGDGHADHRAAFAIGRGLSVARLFSYPISSRYDGKAYSAPPEAVVVAPEPGDNKRLALDRHRSQSLEGGARFPISPTTIDRFCSEPEIFIPVAQGGS